MTTENRECLLCDSDGGVKWHDGVWYCTSHAFNLKPVSKKHNIDIALEHRRQVWLTQPVPTPEQVKREKRTHIYALVAWGIIMYALAMLFVFRVASFQKNKTTPQSQIESIK